MKYKIGILGMSDDSNDLYLRYLSSYFSDKELIPRLYPTNFDSINSLLPNRSPELKNLLKSYLDSLNDLDYLLVPNITLHETLDELFKSTEYSFTLIHPVHSLIEHLKSRKVENVVLFGSEYTMKTGYISEILKVHNIQCEFPVKSDSRTIDELRKSVFGKTTTTEIIYEFNDLVFKYSKETSVVLACTELSMVCNKLIDNVYDMVYLTLREMKKII